MEHITECTCGAVNCYSCRRQAIDATATAIYYREIKWCTGMEGFDVEAHAAKMASQYRYPAINALAMETLDWN